MLDKPVPLPTKELSTMEPEIISNYSLEFALEECRRAARRGYEIAKANILGLSNAIDSIYTSISQYLKTLEHGRVRTQEVVKQLKKQLTDVVSELNQIHRRLDIELEEHRKNLDKFSIALFGRTMAGKSTLMEILTRGDGRSIGTGAQRTTKDIRRYFWKGLEVTDVPGVAAFEGAKDEELAFKAALEADLVLFLVTDDAPQPVEAEWLARVIRLGKPVLGICNVKVAVDDDDDLLLFLRNPDRPFDQTRLEQLISQFHAFVDQHMPGKRIPFLVTHLRSRFLAQQPDYAQYRDRLLAASRFGEIESHIIKEVVERGTFLRFKSFVDGAATTMMDLTELLLKLSAQNSSSGRVFNNKFYQLWMWSQEFQTYGQERINTFVSKTMNTLRDKVPSFVEEHYEDRSAGKNWEKEVESIGIESGAEKLQKELIDKCKRGLNEVARELRTELSLVESLSGDRHIQMKPIFDSKRAWNWSVTILTSSLSITAIIFASGPLGWTVAAVGVIGWLFSWLIDDREEKARRAREKLTKKLFDDINRMEGELRKKLSDWFHQELISKQVNVLLNDLEAVASGLFGLAYTQRNLAWILNDKQKALARILVEKALVQLKAEDLKNLIVDIARVPGLATMFVIQPNTTFPGQIREKLEHLLGEQIWFVVDSTNRLSILVQAIDREFDLNSIRIEENIRVAYLPLDDLGPVTKARIRLAQQLTGLHIMNALAQSRR